MSVSVVWIVGQYKSGEFPNIVWEFQGVFSSRSKAVDACKNRNYFIGSTIMDEPLPDETCKLKDSCYPCN